MDTRQPDAHVDPAGQGRSTRGDPPATSADEGGRFARRIECEGGSDRWPQGDPAAARGGRVAPSGRSRADRGPVCDGR